MKRIFKKILFRLKKQNDIVILDDLFPHFISAFRNIEFETYLKTFDSVVYTSGNALSFVKEKKGISDIIKEYTNTNRNYRNKVHLFDPYIPIKAKMCYVMFLHNVFNYLPFITKNKLPFIFTLYPGGGFRLNNHESDTWLQQVLSSPYFRGVIVTQKVTSDYLVQKSFCDKSKIHFIYGVVSSLQVEQLPLKKQETNKINICFVGNKYTDKGFDKGFDVFIDTATILLQNSNNFHFHVVGSFSEHDIDVSHIKENITFYGMLEIHKLTEFYKNQDILVSPNRANTLGEGAFDGFLLGSCIEAILHGVALFVSDDLNQNLYFIQDEDIVLIDHSAINIANKITEYTQNISKLHTLTHKGHVKALDIFSYENQLQPRIDIIKNQLAYE